jgi:hypothetical protein
MGDPGHSPAAGAPDRVENLELRITGESPPDVFGPGCKRVPSFKNPSSVVFFVTNKTITGFTMKEICPYHFSSTIKIRGHFRGGRHLHLSFGVAPCAEFLLHDIQQ